MKMLLQQRPDGGHAALKHGKRALPGSSELPYDSPNVGQSFSSAETRYTPRMSELTRSALDDAGGSRRARRGAGDDVGTGRAGAAAALVEPAPLSALRRLHRTPHTGNQLAVFMEPQGLATEAMAAMTREMNFSECTFVFPPEAAGTDIRLRIFGRGGEMPFAGHPVIGSAFALADDGVIAAGQGRGHLRPRHRADAGGARVGRPGDCASPG